MDFDDKTFVLGVGAQKAGTTWLYEYFAERDDIYVPPLKEMHYFDVKFRPDLCGYIGRRFVKQLRKWTAEGREAETGKRADVFRSLKARVAFKGRGEAYREYFRESVPASTEIFGEITPSYSLLREDGFREIRSLFRNIRLIFIMRDPVDRFYSQVRYIKPKTPKTHEQLIEKRMRDPRYVERSLYQNTIRNMETVFKKGEILYLFYETLFEPPAIRELCQWLGVDYVTPKFSQVVNASKPPREEISPALWREVQETFRPTYEFCRDKFGDGLPKSWLAIDSIGKAQTSSGQATQAALP